MIYMDNSATTRVRREVVEAMLPCYERDFGNASSIYYDMGADAGKLLADARKVIADFIGATSRELYFTSGGTESDNWAIKSVARGLAARGKRIITSKIEHHAVLHSFQALQKEGFEVVYLDVDEYGQVDTQQLQREINAQTTLVSVMMVNNEVGTIQDMKKIAEITHQAGALLHTDAVQALGILPIDVKDLGVDLASFSAPRL